MARCSTTKGEVQSVPCGSKQAVVYNVEGGTTVEVAGTKYYEYLHKPGESKARYDGVARGFGAQLEEHRQYGPLWPNTDSGTEELTGIQDALLLRVESGKIFTFENKN